MKRCLLFLAFLSTPLLAARGPSDPLPSNFQMFPANNIWNTRIDSLPVSSSSTYWIDNTTFGEGLTPIFGTTYAGVYWGTPYNIMCLGVTPNAPVTWASGAYVTESATLPVAGLPIPSDAIVEGDPMPLNPANDNHLVLVDTCSSTGYDIFQASRVFVGGVWNGSWTIMSLTTWTYTSNSLWPDGWTTSTAAGTPMLPELVNWNEVNAGAITHAVGFTLPYTHGPHIWPARHDANSGGTNDPPFGIRLRLKAAFDVSSFSATNQVILNALKKYGMYLIDNGSYWNLAGAPSPNWNNTDVQTLSSIIISTNTFEMVDESGLMVDPNSGQATQTTSTGSKSWSGKFTISGSATVQ